MIGIIFESFTRKELLFFLKGRGLNPVSFKDDYKRKDVKIARRLF
jgi:hypothetical protein